MTFNHILAVIDDTTTSAAVVKKSVILANKSRADLTILRVQRTHTFNLSQLFHRKTDDSAPPHSNKLLREYPFKNKEVEIKECQSHSIHQAVVNECEQYDYDLVVVSHKYYPPFFNEFMIADEWHLLRSPSIPVMFVDSKDWQEDGHILTALEIDNDNGVHQDFNKQLIKETKTLAGLLHNDVHLINCYLENPFDMAFTRHNQVVLSVHDEHEAKLAHIAQKYHLEKEKIHIEHGLPEDTLSEMASQLDVNMLIIGSCENQGIANFLSGHTSEYVLNRIKTDIYAIKPSTARIN